jgi:hypothetical protein
LFVAGELGQVRVGHGGLVVFWAQREIR